MNKEKVKLTSFLVIGILTLLISGPILLGWQLGYEFMESILPSYVFMAHNTALCFSLLGISLIVFHSRLIWISRIFASFVIILSILTAMQYVFKVNLYIDDIFIRDLPSISAYNLRKVSFGSCVILFLLSSSLLIITLRKHTIGIFLAIFLSCLALSVSLGNLIGYFFGFENAFTWENISQVSFLTITVAILLSLALLTYSILETLGTCYRIYTLAIAVELATASPSGSCSVLKLSDKNFSIKAITAIWLFSFIKKWPSSGKTT